jgi:hypothetical protein
MSAWDRRSPGSDVIQGFLTGLQTPGGEVIFSLNTWTKLSQFKGTVSRDFLLRFFRESSSPRPLIIALGSFRIFFENSRRETDP